MARREATVTVWNETPFTMELLGSNMEHGEPSDDEGPPPSIEPHGSVTWKTETEKLSLYGIEGTAIYRVLDGDRTDAASNPTRNFDELHLKWENPLNGRARIEAHMEAGSPQPGELSPPTTPPSPTAPSDYRLQCDPITVEDGRAGQAERAVVLGPWEALSSVAFMPYAFMNVHARPGVPIYRGGMRVASPLSSAPPPPPSWRTIGTASGAKALTAGSTGLIGLDGSNRLNVRSIEATEESWRESGEAGHAVQIAAAGDVIYAITAGRELVVDDGGAALAWRTLGDADVFGSGPAVQTELSPLAESRIAPLASFQQAQTVTEGLQLKADSRPLSITLRTSDVQLADAGATAGPPASPPAEIGLQGGPLPQLSALAVRNRVEALAVSAESLYAISSSGELWVRHFASASDPWEWIDLAPISRSLTAVQGVLYCLSEDRIWTRPAQAAESAWLELTWATAPVTLRALAGASVSAAASCLFGSSSSDELWVLELPTRIF